MSIAELIYFDAGGGHRAAATALRAVMEQQPEWEVRLTNLQELLDPIDPILRLTGLRMQDFYNLMLKKGWTWGTGFGVRVLQGAIRLRHGSEVRLLESHWRRDQPDIVVSLVPHFNRAILEGLRRVTPLVPFVTILTDLADYPPHFWIERQEQFLICGSERAVSQARALGHSGERISKASGMILHPKFYQPLAIDRPAERRRLGLDPDLPTGLVLFGGLGSGVMLKIAREVDASKLELQLIFICGHNERLAERLRQTKGRIPKHVVGFTTEVPAFMRLADFFIGKPGPGSISEALAMELPVIVECNARTLPQERYNAEWVVEKQVGLVVRSPREITPAIAELLEPAHFARFRAHAAAMNNRAVLEIPGMLREILQKTAGPSSAPAHSAEQSA